jgi:hypothetical protein
MKRILCWLIGHKWAVIYVGNGYVQMGHCMRCGARHDGE